MPPKRIQVQPARRQQKASGYLGSAYEALTSEENRSVVISLAMFGVSSSRPVSSNLNNRNWTMAGDASGVDAC
jgi:hypothetical protein